MVRLSSKVAVLISAMLVGAAAPGAAAETTAQQRLALMTGGDASAADRAARMWRLAELEEHAGNPDLAVIAANDALTAAGVAAALDGLAASGPDAPPAFTETMRKGLALGDRLGDPTLVIAAVSWWPELAKTNADAVRKALLLRPWSLPEDLRDEVLAAVAGDAAWHVYLTSAWNRPETLPDATLETLGPLGARVLRERLRVALADGDVTGARSIVDRLLRMDRFSLRVRAGKHALDEAAAGAALTAADIAAVVDESQRVRHAGVTLKIERLLRDKPAANGLALTLAYQMWSQNLFVDGARLAARVAADPRATPEQRLTADELVALTALDAGDEGRFVDWVKRSGAGESAALAHEVLMRVRAPRAGKGRPPSAARRIALRATFARPFGPTTKEAQLTWADDTALEFDDEDLRTRALRVVALQDPAHARLIEACRRMNLAADECSARRGLLNQLALFNREDDDDDEDRPSPVSDPADVLDRLTDLPANGLLALARAPRKKLAALGARVARLHTERYEGTAGLSELELAIRIARGELAAARELLARVGPSLPHGDRVALALALDPALAPPAKARGDHGADEDAPVAEFDLPSAVEAGLVSKPTANEKDEEDAEALDDDDGSGDAVSRLTRIFHGRWAAARSLKRLPPVWRRLGGIAGAETAAWVWVLARDAQSAKLAGEASARVHKLAPRGDLAARLDAELTLESARPALESARRLWTATPSSVVAAQIFFSAWAREAGAHPLPSAASAWWPRVARTLGDQRLLQVARVVRKGAVKDVAELRALDDARDDSEKLLAFSPDVVPVARLSWWIEDQYAKRKAEDASELAKRVVTFLAKQSAPATDEQRVVQLHVWSRLLAGDVAGARAALQAQPRGGPRRPRYAPPLPFTRSEVRVLELAFGLSTPFDTAARQALFRQFSIHEKGTEDFAGDLAKRADTAAPKSDAPALREMACLASAHGLKRNRSPLCRRAWSAGVRSAFVAKAVASALAEDPGAARSEGFDAGGFFSDAHAALKPVPPEVERDEAAWLASLRRTREAAILEASALANGDDRFYPATHVLDWARVQPLLAAVEVSLSQHDDAERAMALGLTAALAGDAEASERYFRSAIRATDGEETPSQPHKDARSRSSVFLAMLEVARADLARSQLDGPALAESVDALIHQEILTALPPLRRRLPQSRYLALLAIDSSPSRLAGDPVLDRLRAELPTNPMVARVSYGMLVLAKRFPEAKAVLEAARKAHPGDPLLADLATPTSPAEAPPAWATTPQAFADALAKAAPAPVADAEYRSWDAGNLDAYVPKTFEHEDSQTFGFQHEGVRLLGMRFPRVTHCQAAACLDELAVAFEPQGIKKMWTRPVRLPIGDAHEGMFRGPAGFLIATAIPMGTDVIFLSMGGPTEKFHEALPAVRMFRESIRATDAALGRARTALLARRARSEHGEAELRARQQPLDDGRTGCPLGAEPDLKKRPASFGALLTRLYLATPRRPDRLRLLACTSAARETSVALGLAALWDGSQDSVELGRAIFARRPSEAADLLGEGLDLTTEHGTSNDILEGSDALVAGTLQALAALPPAARATLVERFRSSGEPRQDALAIAAVRWAPDAIAVAAQEEILLEGSEANAAMLLAALPPTLEAPLLAAARKRLDALAPPFSGERLHLVAALSTKVALALDAADGPRLARARSALRDASDGEGHAIARARRAVDVHAAALLGEAGSLETRAALARLQSATDPSALRATPAGLDLPLAQRLPDHGWTFFRVGQPRAFVAALSDALQVTGDVGADRAAPGRLLLSRFFGRVGADRLSAAGIDADQPLECARATGDVESWMCTGRLSDEAAWRQHVETSASPEDGLKLPQVYGELATGLPTLTMLLPVMVPDPSVKRSAGEHEKGWLVAEHVRDRRSIAGLDLWRDADVRVSRDHVLTVKETLSLVVGRRVWLFSDEGALRQWLAMPTRAANDAGRAANAAAQPGALVAFWPENEDDDVPGGFTFAIDATSEGVRLRTSSAISAVPTATDALAARLPAGAALSFTAPNVAALPVVGFHRSMTTPLGDGAPPPWLWIASSGAAFGWYGGGAGAERWLTAVRWEPSVVRAWHDHRMPEPTGQPAAQGPWTFARIGDVLVVASDRGLVDASLAAKSRDARGPAVTATMRGSALSELLDRRAARAPKGTQAANTLKGWAMFASMFASIDTTARMEGGALVAESWVRPASRRGGGLRSLVDALLGSRTLKNSLRLPVDLDDQRGELPVTLVVRGSRPDEIRRVFPGTDRLSVRDGDGGLERVHVLPAPGPRPRAPLSADERHLYTAASGAPSPAIQATARDVTAGLASPWDRARAIVAWVHREMTYEITPATLDDVTLLEKRRGDCTEYAQLTIALLRALDIPARARNGLLGAGRSLVAHAWVEFHDGEAWHELDPTAGRTSVDASYVDASIVDLLPLLTGSRFEIAGIE